MSVPATLKGKDCPDSSCEDRIYGFEPYIPDGCHILILGSMPSVKSLEQGFYYANKQNRMFKLIACYYARSLGLKEGELVLSSIEQRKAALSALGIGMWDVVDSCERKGSLDSNIKNAHYADIISLIKKYPTIKHVLTCGNFASKHFAISTLKDSRYLNGEVSFNHYALPSTSAANTIKFDLLKERYDAVLLKLLPYQS